LAAVIKAATKKPKVVHNGIIHNRCKILIIHTPSYSYNQLITLLVVGVVSVATKFAGNTALEVVSSCPVPPTRIPLANQPLPDQSTVKPFALELIAEDWLIPTIKAYLCSVSAILLLPHTN